jgi:3-deoxy-D-manno-octulosonic-acid transferase
LRHLYTLLFYLALPFVFLRLLWRSRRSADYRKRWDERLGFSPQTVEKCIWVHAASVGETLAAIPLIKALKSQYPTVPVLVTNMTITGAARTRAAFGDSVLQSYAPYDVPGAIERFIKRMNPVIALILETELWPNIFYICQQHHIPVVVANARLSEKSAAGYARVAAITRQMLLAVDKMAVQTRIEADRFETLGLPAARIEVTGNLKFDIELPADLTEKSAALRAELGKDRLIWIAASTHATEEEIVLAAHKRVCEKFPHALLILVPRHPERFNDVFQLVQQQKFQAVRRSQQTPCTADTQVYLSDTMGEMFLMYAVTDVAFVAGSFALIGGHNMLEAAVLMKPVISGPQLFNFAEISASLIAAKGMSVVQNAEELAAAVSHLFEDPEYRKICGDNASRFVDANRGALAKQLQIVKTVIDGRLQARL